MNAQMKFISTIAILLLLTVGATMLFPGCGDKISPTGPALIEVDCPHNKFGIVSAELLSRPVVSKFDNHIYYHDTGYDSAYFDAWFDDIEIRPWGTPGFKRGIYRINPNDNSPAELVAEFGDYPEFSPDGKTLLFLRDGIWRIRLPDGEPELIDERPFARAKWFSEDTLVVKIPMNPNVHMLDLITDSLIILPGLTGLPDVSPDRKILWVFYDNGNLIGICDFDADSIWYLRPVNAQHIAYCYWAPDGNRFIFLGNSVDNGQRDTWIIDLNGRERSLPHFPGGHGRFTPDGRHIVFVRNPFADCGECQANQVWMRSAITGVDIRQVTTWSRIRP